MLALGAGEIQGCTASVGDRRWQRMSLDFGLQELWALTSVM